MTIRATNDERVLGLTNAGVPTQLANPWRTQLRTFVQSLVGLLIVLVPLVNVTLVMLSGYLQEQTDLAVPGWAFAAVNIGIAITSFVIGLVARLMTVPGVAAFIAQRLPWLAPIKPSRTTV